MTSARTANRIQSKRDPTPARHARNGLPCFAPVAPRKSPGDPPQAAGRPNITQAGGSAPAGVELELGRIKHAEPIACVGGTLAELDEEGVALVEALEHG